VALRHDQIKTLPSRRRIALPTRKISVPVLMGHPC
jgi:hypothetical protein